MVRPPQLRGISLCVVFLFPMILWAATDGPDASGLILIDSSEDEGPPHTWLRMDAGLAVAPGLTGLPFAFTFGAFTFDDATLSADGSLVFSGDAAPCVGDGDWMGVLTGGAGPEITRRSLGRYPRRGVAWDWGNSQLVLLEDRSEAVIHVASVSDGRGMGAQAGPGSGVTWGCGDGPRPHEASAWISSAETRSVAHLRSTATLRQAWWGSHAASFFGESAKAGECNGDGLSEVLVGQPEADKALLFFGAHPAGFRDSVDATFTVTGPSDSGFGTSVLLADLDGDGKDDVIVGAPDAGDGVVYIFLAASGLSGERGFGDADGRVVAPVGLGSMGQSLATGDFDGDGALDLAVGGPEVHSVVPFGGAIMVAYGPDIGIGVHTPSAENVRIGDTPGGLLGSALVAIDLDGDGADELAVSSPGGAGQVGVFSAAGPIFDAEAILVISGADEGDEFGSSLAAGALDDELGPDLLVGAVGVSDLGARTGAAYIFLNPGLGLMGSDDADVRIGGLGAASATGAAVEIGQLSEAGPMGVVIGATGGDAALGGGGMVGIFRSCPIADVSLNAADHRLYGTSSGAELGAVVVVAPDIQGDGYPDLLVAAPLDSPGERTGAGAVWVWPFVPAFLDDDADGFVAAASGGLDCDDNSAAVNPNMVENPSNVIDDDCDGWVDGWFVPRRSNLGWRYDLDDVLFVDSGTVFDFEDAVEGASADDTYTTLGMSLIASGVVRVKPSIWGAAPVGTLGARVTAGPDANDLIFDFLAPVDAVSMRILDAEVGLRMDALFEGEPVVEGYFFESNGPDTPGGVFQGFTFASPIDTLRIAASTPNGWGVDDIEVVFSAGSDRDGDGWTAADGDCDDFDPDVGPDAEEVFGDGIDNDCDGVVDGGAAGVYYTEGAFVSDVSMIGDRIDFESIVLGASVSDQYTLRGVVFSGGVTVVDGVDDTLPRDAQAGSIDTDTLYLDFIENQPALAFWLLDVDGQVTLEARRDGLVMYEETLVGGYSGFIGLYFPVPIDSFVLRNSISGEAWGLDDLTFSVLGLDDADGDGFTERDGDCDDADPEAYPGGTETWYDGVDGDCDGADDFDADGDGYAAVSGGGFDCDDFVDTTHPGAEDAWYDGVDADCRGDDDFDADGDGHSSASYGGTDCDDGSSAVHPDAPEVFYDEVDDDCDPTTDFDADGDGFASSGFPGAIGAIGVGDCDDTSGATHPDAVDTWYDGIDSDCDGADDFDADGDGHIPIEYGGDDCDDGDGLAVPGSPIDACYDGVDADCDGHSDFDCDRDGHDATIWGGDDCDDSDPSVYPGDGSTAEGLDADCDGYVSAEAGGDDCDDGDASVHPGAVELWYDGVDSDCDSGDDYDRDGDGHRPGAWAADGVAADCDDADASVYPGATDGCGGGDEDCDGELDEDCGSAPDGEGGTPTDTGDPEPTEPAVEPDTGSEMNQLDTGISGEDTAEALDSGAAPDAEDAAVILAGATDELSSTDSNSKNAKGCGCQSTGSVPSWMWVLPLFVGARRRTLKIEGE